MLYNQVYIFLVLIYAISTFSMLPLYILRQLYIGSSRGLEVRVLA